MSVRVFHLEPESPREMDHLVASLERAGIRDPRVLTAVRQTPRDYYVPPEWAETSAGRPPEPVPRSFGRHASDPAVIALIAEALELRGDEKVLLVGASYGYPAALLSRLAKRVVAIEIVADFADQARRNLEREGIGGVRVVKGDGVGGFPEEAPYDAIAVCTLDLSIADADVAGIEWASQLREGGRLVLLADVFSSGRREEGEVAVFERRGGRLEGPVRLVVARSG